MFQILHEVDTILFSLLILCGLVDSNGRVWRCHPNQLYAIEVTVPRRGASPEAKPTIPESKTLTFLELLPIVSCMSPVEMLKNLNAPHRSGMIAHY